MSSTLDEFSLRRLKTLQYIHYNKDRLNLDICINIDGSFSHKRQSIEQNLYVFTFAKYCKELHIRTIQQLKHLITNYDSLLFDVKRIYPHMRNNKKPLLTQKQKDLIKQSLNNHTKQNQDYIFYKCFIKKTYLTEDEYNYFIKNKSLKLYKKMYYISYQDGVILHININLSRLQLLNKFVVENNGYETMLFKTNTGFEFVKINNHYECFLFPYTNSYHKLQRKFTYVKKYKRDDYLYSLYVPKLGKYIPLVTSKEFVKRFNK